jgi:hypothetical protein
MSADPGPVIAGTLPGPAHPASPALVSSAESESGHSPTAAVRRALAQIKGQAHFLLYLADQVEDALGQCDDEPDSGREVFLAKILSMYAAQLETKHQGLGDRITEACQDLYILVRDLESR